MNHNSLPLTRFNSKQSRNLHELLSENLSLVVHKFLFLSSSIVCRFLQNQQSVRKNMPHGKEALDLVRILLDFHQEIHISSQRAVLRSILEPRESPPKPQNVQTLIKFIKKFDDSLQSLWNILKDETILYSHEYSAWKFCHVLNQMLIEGPRSVLVSAYNNRRVLKNVGTYWKRSTLDIGQLILEYCKFLVRKVKFHSKYPQIPGDSTYDFKRLERECDLFVTRLDFYLTLKHFIFLERFCVRMCFIYCTIFFR